jgi:hypothetical protein
MPRGSVSPVDKVEIPLGVLDTVLSGLGFVVGLVVWAAGAWQVYEANTLLGAILALVGGVLAVFSIAWWRRDPDAGIEGVLHEVVEFLSRAR